MEMEDKEYPVFEEDVHVDKCCIGPYTIDELNARIDEAETYIEKAERGDWSDWVTEKQSRANLYSKYPWLR